MLSKSALFCLAISCACSTSISLSENPKEMQVIFNSGKSSLNKTRAKIESTPPLNAKDIWFGFSFSTKRIIPFFILVSIFVVRFFILFGVKSLKPRFGSNLCDCGV